MLSLIIITTIYSFLLSSVQSILLDKQTKEMGSRSSLEYPARLLSRNYQSSLGSFSCVYPGRVISRTEIDDIVAYVCNKINPRQQQSHAKISSCFSTNTIKLPLYKGKDGGYHTWLYVIPNVCLNEQKDQEEYKIYVAQDPYDKSRCFPEFLYRGYMSKATECLHTPLRELENPIASLPETGQFNCGGQFFSVTEVRNAMKFASETLDNLPINTVEKAPLFPRRFRDYLYKHEYGSWMYPLLKNGKVFEEGDPGLFRVVIWQHGDPFGVVYKRSNRERLEKKEELDYAIEFKVCKFEKVSQTGILSFRSKKRKFV